MQKTTTNRRDLYQEVTDIIIRQLESGTVPWRQPWGARGKVTPGLPRNGTTHKKYRGINILTLWCTAYTERYTSDEWGTYRQWSEQHEQVRRGEKGTLIIYFDKLEIEKDGEIEKIPFIKPSYVFNRCQLDSYKADQAPTTPAADLVNRVTDLDRYIANTGAKIIHEGNQPMYYGPDDAIYMPEPACFLDDPECSATESYYATLTHELTHWTGAAHRLARNAGKERSDKRYANEELVAELGAAFLCAEFGVNRLENQQHAAYIAEYLPKLKENKYCIFTAASEASKAVDYLNQLQQPAAETALTTAVG